MTADLRGQIRDVLDTHPLRCRDCRDSARPCSGCNADAAILIVSGLVELIATGFDERAEVAKVANREHRDIDALLAWESSAAYVRTYAPDPSSASVEPQTSPGGTPGAPSVPGYAHAYTVTFDGDTHWLACDFCESPIVPIEAADSLDEIVTKARDHERRCSMARPATSPGAGCPTRIAHESGAVHGCQLSADHTGPHWTRGAGVWWAEDDRVINDYSRPATSPTGDPTP